MCNWFVKGVFLHVFVAFTPFCQAGATSHVMFQALQNSQLFLKIKSDSEFQKALILLSLPCVTELDSSSKLSKQLT